jgi:ketosteroid isomerase-like protein
MPGPSAAQDLPPRSDLVPLAQAYTAAWNAHDLAAVLACFAPDAVVRERRGEVPPAVWDTRDPQVVRAYLEDSGDGLNYNPSALVWVTGHQEIAAWAAAAFAHRHRFAATQFRAAGDTVRWRYREFVDPYQLAPGVSPAEGEAEAVVRSGRIAVLSLVQSPASVQQQRGEGTAAFARAMATGRAASLGSGPRGPLRGPGGVPASESEPVTWPLVLSTLAVLAVATGALRRRRAPRG